MREYSTEEQSIVIQSVTDPNYFLGHIKALGNDEEWKNIIEIKKKITERLKHVSGNITQDVCMQQAEDFWNERKAYYDKYSEKYPNAEWLECYKVPKHISDNEDYIALTAAYMNYILVKMSVHASIKVSQFVLTQNLYKRAEVKFCYPWLEKAL